MSGEGEDVFAWIEGRFPYDGPHSANAVMDAGTAAARLVRYLNNATQRKHVLEFPSTTDYVVAAMVGVSYGLQQLLDQLSADLRGKADDPALYDDRRTERHPAATTAVEAAIAVQQARQAAARLSTALEQARSHTTHLGLVTPDEGEQP